MACLLSIGNPAYNFWNGTIQSHLISKSINQSEIALIKNQRSNQYYPFPFPFFFPFFPLIELLYTIICNVQILIIKIMGKNLKFFSKFLKGKKGIVSIPFYLNSQQRNLFPLFDHLHYFYPFIHFNFQSKEMMEIFRSCIEIY